jgi:uncharacterized FlgJ-related protein
MKQVVRLTMLLAFASFVFTACGGKFHAGGNPQAAEVRPPATSDPETAEDMRRFEAGMSEETVVAPVLETEDERESFFKDLNEQKPMYTDDELGEKAEEDFQKREKRREKKRAEDAEKAAKETEKKLNDKAAQQKNGQGAATNDQDAGSDETPQKPQQPAHEPQQAQNEAATPKDGDAQPQVPPQPVAKNDEPQTPAPQPPEPKQEPKQEPKHEEPKKQEPPKQNDPKPAEPKKEEPKKADPKPVEPKKEEPKKPEPKPEPKKEEPKKPQPKKDDADEGRPKAPVSAVRNEFCEKLNVTSGKEEVDLSDLYNSDDHLLVSMPTGALAEAKSQDKKNRFVCALLPIAIRMNEEVFRQRLEVLRMQNKQKKNISFTKDDQIWLGNMKTAYNLSADAPINELLKRVDIMPLPLLLGQAAKESGWGTSKATKDLKNLFGLHAAQGQPCKRGYDTNNSCVREFKTLSEGVSAYIRLLNIGTNYVSFRDARAKMRARGAALDSMKLIAEMTKYNEKPAAYIQSVRDIMASSNKLTKFEFDEEEAATAQKDQPES